MYWVYILALANGKFYIGQTNNLSSRLRRHQTSQCRATKPFLPVRLVYKEQHISRQESVARERYLKSLKSHKALEHIITTGDGLIV